MAFGEMWMVHPKPAARMMKGPRGTPRKGERWAACRAGGARRKPVHLAWVWAGPAGEEADAGLQGL